MANNPWNVHEVSMFLKYCCPECDYQITQLDIFEDHATSSHELSKILFENIDKFVETKNGFQIKEEVNDMSEYNDYDIESNNCDRKLKTNLKEEADEHMLEEFDCNFCDYKTNQKSHLNAHLKKQHNELPFTCTLCDWKTDQNCNLNLHLFKQHGEYSNPCHICDFKTYQPTKLDNHLLDKHGISKFTGDFACHICDYKTDQSSSLNNHLLKLHDIHSNPCHICDFKTHQPSKLAEHLLEEHGISKYSGHLACHLCHYKTDQSHHLNKHILKHHGEYSNPCHICDFKTHLPTKLTEHLYKEHDISRFSGDFACHLCDFKTDSRTNINKHVTKLHNEFSEYAYSCHFCEFKSNLKTELKKHALDLHNISNYVCDPPNKIDGKKHLCHLCDFQADLHRNLTRHLKLTHGENMSKGRGKEGSKCCHICDFRTNYRSGLRSHVATMHGEDELKKISIYSKANISYTKDENGFNVCPFPLCDYKSKETGNLKRHYARIHKNIELDTIAPKSKEDKDSKKCHLCKFSSKFNSNLRNHIVRSHGKSELNGSSKQIREQSSQNEPQNSQEDCPETYDVNPLIKVECEIEETDSLLKCDKCDKSFPTKYDLNNHKKENHGYGIDWQSDGLCPHCGEYYKKLAQHILYKHETNKPWKCEKCDFAHASRKGLNAHIRHNHKSENDLHVCHICAYKAKSKANMKEHIECVHEKLRFQCQVCEKEFSSKSKLKSHVKLSHLGELLECKECGETFNERNRLYLHVKKVHKGVEYRCKICKKDFRDARGLKRHEINIHGVEHEYKSGPNKGSVMKPGALK